MIEHALLAALLGMAIVASAGALRERFFDVLTAAFEALP